MGTVAMKVENHKNRKTARVTTTFMELLTELSSSTHDDALVIAAVKNIFQSYKVRFGRALAPVRLVGEASGQTLRRPKLDRRKPAWA